MYVMWCVLLHQHGPMHGILCLLSSEFCSGPPETLSWIGMHSKRLATLHGCYSEHGLKVAVVLQTMAYRLNEETGIIDYDMLEKTATLYRPKLLVAGASAYPRYCSACSPSCAASFLNVLSSPSVGVCEMAEHKMFFPALQDSCHAPRHYQLRLGIFL